MTTPENSISALEVAESPDVCVTDNASVKRAVKQRCSEMPWSGSISAFTHI